MTSDFVTTKQVVMKVTSELMSLTPDEHGQPSAVALNQLADEVAKTVVRKYGGELQSIHGAVALAYAIARFMAPAIVATSKTQEDLANSLHTITDLVSTTMRMSLETAWTHAHGQPAQQEKPLLITIPGPSGGNA